MASTWARFHRSGFQRSCRPRPSPASRQCLIVVRAGYRSSGRLRQNVSLAQAQRGLQPWFKAMLDEDARRTNVARANSEQRRQQFLASTLALTPAPPGHSVLRHEFSRPLWVLFVATVVLLALACLNVAGLFLARGSARHREVSTRLALGEIGRA